MKKTSHTSEQIAQKFREVEKIASNEDVAITVAAKR